MNQPNQQTVACPPVQDAATTQKIIAGQEAMQHEQLQFEEKQSVYAHQRDLANELAIPSAFVMVALLVMIAAIYLIRSAIEAGVRKNEDDNKAQIEMTRISGTRIEAEA